MAPLICNRSLRISRDVVETEFVPTCKIMTFGFFFKIGIMWWLTSAKVAPLKSCTFTKRFLQGLLSSIPVKIESSTITQIPGGQLCLTCLGEASFTVQFSSEISLLFAFWKRSNCWRFCFLQPAICLLILVELVGILAQSSLSLTLCCI